MAAPAEATAGADWVVVEMAEATAAAAWVEAATVEADLAAEKEALEVTEVETGAAGEVAVDGVEVGWGSLVVPSEGVAWAVAPGVAEGVVRETEVGALEVKGALLVEAVQ